MLQLVIFTIHRTQPRPLQYRAQEYQCRPTCQTIEHRIRIINKSKMADTIALEKTGKKNYFVARLFVVTARNRSCGNKEKDKTHTVINNL
jgi:hypothetical protein